MIKNIFWLGLISVILFFPSTSFAQFTPFGGFSINVINCDLSGNFLITNLPSVAGPARIIYQKGISKLYEYREIEKPGNWLLGTVSFPVPCVKEIAGDPVYLGSYPLIVIVGTSDKGRSSGGGGTGGGGGGGGSDPGDDPEEPLPPGGEDDSCSGDADTLASRYIMANEGWRNSCYRDTGRNLTVGVGHLVTARDEIDCSRPLTDEQVGDLYSRDYAEYRSQAEASARRHGVDWDSLSPERQAVLTDMSFNMGAQGGEGLDGFDEMWGAIDRAQSTTGAQSQEYWNIAGDEITDTETDYGRGARAVRNRTVMRTNDPSALNRRINGDPHARAYCA